MVQANTTRISYYSARIGKSTDLKIFDRTYGRIHKIELLEKIL